MNYLTDSVTTSGNCFQKIWLVQKYNESVLKIVPCSVNAGFYDMRGAESKSNRSYIVARNEATM